MAQLAMIVPFALALLLLPSHTGACSVPPGGCVPSKCERLKTLQPPRYGSGNIQDPAIGFYAGGFNHYWNFSNNNGLGWESVRGGPYVNYEVFPAVETAYLISNAEAPLVDNLGDCCALCARTANCALYQFFNGTSLSEIQGILGGNPSVLPGGAYSLSQQCYLLSGGSVNGTKEGPYGTPYSGPKNLQIGANKNIVPSWVGGLCNPNSTVVDDPHFVGAYGTRFDFNGAVGRVFSLLSDKGIQVNILLGGYLDSRTLGATVMANGKAIRTWIQEIGLVWVDGAGKRHSVSLVARRGKDDSRGSGYISSIVLDGENVQPPNEQSPEATKDTFNLFFLGLGTAGSLTMETYRLEIAGHLDMVLKLRPAHPLLQTEDESFVHFNVHIHRFLPTHHVHGLLGQTFRNSGMQYYKALEYQMLGKLLGGPIAADGETGKGFLEGEPVDYEMESLLSTEGKFSSFQ